MQVKQLIEWLQTQPQDAHIEVHQSKRNALGVCNPQSSKYTATLQLPTVPYRVADEEN